MLDINYIRKNKEKVKENIRNRGLDIDLDRFLDLDQKRNKLIQEVDRFRSQKNKIKKKPTQVELHKLKIEKEKEEKLAGKLEALTQEHHDFWFKIPNMTDPAVKVADETVENPVLEKCQELPKYSFEPKDHLEIAEKLGLIDLERAAKVTGSKFYYLKKEAALLEFALIQYALQVVTKHGFVPFSTPDIARKEILEGLGYNPRGESTQVYNIENSDLSLIGTAEITMGGYHQNETLPLEELPKKYVAVSHCFRTEAGSYSKYAKGIFRVHQFTKVEMFEYALPNDSNRAHLEMLEVEKEIYQELKIPYRVIDHTTADMGGPAARTYDLEAWLPGKENEKGGRGDWAEITSASNCTDYQSRGLNIKYQDENGNKDYVHMLNGTAIAVGRTIIAILENYQEKDGSVKVPKVLQKWVGTDKISSKK